METKKSPGISNSEERSRESAGSEKEEARQTFDRLPHTRTDSVKHPPAVLDPTLASAGEVRSHHPSAGQHVGGADGRRFELVRRLGDGGMAVVFLARDTLLDRLVAIKFLTNAALTTSEALERIRFEAQACARLSHENIVRLFDMGVDKGLPFLVMEYIEGSPLNLILREERIALGRAVEIMTDIARGLSEAHRAGIVHRDLKPSNVIIGKNGAAKILDFGIATMSTDADAPRWEFSGTPRYMAPEQWKGEPQDSRTDIWAAGVMLFEMLTDVSPFGRGNPSEVRNAVLSRDRAPSARSLRPDLPLEVEHILQRAMNKRTSDRFGTADELLEALLALEVAFARDAAEKIPSTTTDRLDEPSPSETSSHRVARTKRKWAARRRYIWPALVVLAVTIGVAFGRRPPKAAAPAFGSEPNRRETSAGAPAATDVDEKMAAAGNLEVTKLLEDGLRAWHDASMLEARDRFRRALELDPDSAAAHLYIAILYMGQGDTIATGHYRAAMVHRTRLGLRDRALLDAYADAVVVPRYLAGTELGLLAARARFPSDWLIADALTSVYMTMGEYTKAVHVCDSFLQNDPSLVIAQYRKYLVDSMLGNIDRARDSMKRCIHESPRADRCLGWLLFDAVRAGRCEEAEQYGDALAKFPRIPVYWSRALAGVAIRRGGTLASARAKRPNMDKDELAHIAILAGEFDRAQRALEEMKAEPANGETYEYLTSIQINIAMETKDTSRARNLADRYLERLGSSVVSNIMQGEMLSRRAQYLLGDLSPAAFAEHRRRWVEQEATSKDYHRTKEEWEYTHALAAKTASDFVNAVHVYDDYRDTVSEMWSGVDFDWIVGRVYLFAGEVERALPVLRRAASNCDIIAGPLEHVWANLDLGTALERQGDLPGACAAYAVVQQRWGHEPRSVSARKARERSTVLHCTREAE
ncbi:protein kinase domain-containing protein [Pendulispora albinea]|uniref:Protein kinase n=1 Tax=Pendulispora albinea TaxID=2741071 RepID=A0ABZ2LQG2_9BACT